MQEQEVRKLLKNVAAKKMSVEEATEELKELPFKDLGFAKVDLHRSLRCGFPEVVLCLGKKPDQVKKILQTLAKKSKETIIATKADATCFRQVEKVLPQARYSAQARLIIVDQKRSDRKGLAVVLSGGTADLPVAEEAALTAEAMGAKVERIYDVGAAGIHRLLHHQKKLHQATAIVVVAGMEGALASVVAGLVKAPVIGVPTSIGYGASFRGVAPLLTMLNSCAAGVAVVNIDNGFGAGYLAATINKLACEKRQH